MDSLEKVLSADPAHVRLEKIETARGYYSNGNFLYDLPPELKGEDLPAGGAPRVVLGETEVLDTPKEALFVSTRTAYPLIDKILDYAQDRSDEGTFDPGARKKTGRLTRISLSDGREIAAMSLSALPQGASWRGTMALSYHILVDSRPVTVLIIGRPLGGPDRLKALIEKRLKEVGEPVLKFSIGGVGLPEEFGIPGAQNPVLDALKESGYKFLAFSSQDMELVWDEMLGWARQGLKLLCTNIKSAGGQSPIETVHVETILGVRVGFISLVPRDSGEVLARKKRAFSVLDPAAAARDAIKELRAGKKVDVIVAISHLTAEQDLKLLQEVEGIDIYLENMDSFVAARRKTVIELSNWNRERHNLPALRATGVNYSFSEIGLGFRKDDTGFELVRIEENPGPTSPDVSPDIDSGEYPEKVLSFFLKPREPLLPDPRMLWPAAQPPKLMYRPAEFWNLAAQALRKETGAEVAFLKINEMDSNVTGAITESYIQQWLLPREHAVTARLSGQALKALWKRFSFVEVPLGRDSMPNRSSEISLAPAGIDKKGRVSGVPLADDEIYTIATTEELLQKTEELPELKEVFDVRPTGRSLADVVFGTLKNRSIPDAELKRLIEGKTPAGLVWRVNLRELSMQFANTQVQNNDGFAQVRDARVQAIGQIVTQAGAKLFSEFYWNRMRWDTGVSADYGRVTLKPKGIAPIVNVIKDSLVFETELRHRSLFLEKGRTRASLGPFANVAYDTQFTKPDDIPKREVVRGKIGLKLFDGSRLKEFYAGPALQTDYSFPTPYTQSGYAAGLRWDSPIPKTPVHLRVDVSYLEFFPSRRDTAADLRRTLDVTAKMRVPFFGNLNLSPFVSYYLFEGKTVKATGYNILFGFALDYSRLWKPFF